jgi:Ni/Co efflux regulator RcnB
MKKLILAAVAASMVAAPAMAAPQYGQHHQAPKKVVVTKKVYKPASFNQYRKWQRGQRFDSRYARNYRQVDNRSFHGRLKAPPRGYRYVQSGNDVVLVSILGGLVGAVFANLIH